MANPLSWGSINGPKQDQDSWAQKMALKAAEARTVRARAIKAVRDMGMHRINTMYAEMIDALRNGEKAEALPVLESFLEKTR